MDAITLLHGGNDLVKIHCLGIKNTEMADGDNADDDAQVSAPLVFSCSKCKTIVGDSFAFLSSNEEANTITLSAASNIQRSAELFTSYEALDEGSTYFCFMCNQPQCLQTLGRFYVTTSKDLDEVREKFTFNIDSITSYELGKAQHGKMPEPVVLTVPESADGGNSSTGVPVASEQQRKASPLFKMM